MTLTTDLPPLDFGPDEADMTYEEKRDRSDADPLWRWRMPEYLPEHEAFVIAKLQAAGYELREGGPSYVHKNGMKEWARPNGGLIINYHLVDGEWIITPHVWPRYYHDLPPCPKCDSIVEADNHASDGYCWSCNLWRERLTTLSADNVIVMNGVYGTPAIYTDSGNRPNARPQDKSHMGFGGSVFDIEAIDGSRTWQTNNLYFGGEIPEAWADEFPITHRLIKKDTTT